MPKRGIAGFGNVMTTALFEVVTISVDAKRIIAGNTTFRRKI